MSDFGPRMNITDICDGDLLAKMEAEHSRPYVGGTRVIAVTEEGDCHDVTEAVRNTFEAIESSMDWGSGFLDIEEVISMSQLAVLCGFRTPDQTSNSLTAYVRATSPWCGICRTWAIEVERDESDGLRFTYPCGHTGRIVQEQGKPSSIVFEETNADL